MLPSITLTPVGLAYLDGAIGFSDVMALQAFRYQYPNGHNLMIAPGLRQMLSGVLIRPAVLVWRVLRRLQVEGLDAFLSVNEIQTYLMRCSTHAETDACVEAIAIARSGGPSLARLPRGRRNSQDWIKFLSCTRFFTTRAGRNAGILLSGDAEASAPEMDGVCSLLEEARSFWTPVAPISQNRPAWYMAFGAVDVGIELSAGLEQHRGATAAEEYPAGEEVDDVRGTGGSLPSAISLRDFGPSALGGTTREGAPDATIESTYDAALVSRAHRLHDEMVILIASTCRARGADIYDDPQSVDLLVVHHGLEFIVEVKSVTARNAIGRLRYAIGQVLHYDYLRAQLSHLPRRKVLALAAVMPPDAWFIPFLNNHCDMDLLSLQGSALRVNSPSEAARGLFTAA